MGPFFIAKCKKYIGPCWSLMVPAAAANSLNSTPSQFGDTNGMAWLHSANPGRWVFPHQKLAGIYFYQI